MTTPVFVLRLREKADTMVYQPFVTDLLREAADVIEDQEEELSSLRDAAIGRCQHGALIGFCTAGCECISAGRHICGSEEVAAMRER